jgi:uncharacterized protein (UPF0548 family)
MKINEMLYLKIPNTLKISRFVENQKELPYTYVSVGATIQDKIEGYDNDFAKAIIGEGEADFERAKQAIRAWKMFPSNWTKILPSNSPIAENTTIAMFAMFAGFWWRNACKIVYVINEKRRFGFAYGTLPGHIESGEELFLVEWGDDNKVYYSIKAFSKPRHLLAKIAYPVMRLLQAKFRKDSLKAMSN